MREPRLLLVCYSVSQVRLYQAFLKRLPKGTIATVMSFNDTSEVNSKIEVELENTLAAFCSFAKMQDECTRAGFSQPTRNTPGKFLFDHPYTDMLEGQINAARYTLTQLNPEILVVMEDGPGGCAPLIKAAKERGLPVVTMPFGIGEDRDYQIFIDQKHAEGNLNFVPDGEVGDKLRQFSSHWIRKTEYGDITLFPAEFVLARISSDLDLPFPWQVQGGHSETLLVESKAMENIYTREGVPLKKQKLVGSLYADHTYQSLKSLPAQTDNGFSKNGTNPRIFLSLPPSYHMEQSRITEFSTYEETIVQLYGAIKKMAPGAKITVGLHPAASSEALVAVRGLGADISDRWIIDEIACHDIFISTFSSTTRWALAAEKIVLNYDMYSFDLPTYDNVPNFLNYTKVQSLADMLQSIINSTSQRSKLHHAVSKISSDWGIMDGKNFDRIWSFLQSAAKEKS